MSAGAFFFVGLFCGLIGMAIVMVGRSQDDLDMIEDGERLNFLAKHNASLTHNNLDDWAVVAGEVPTVMGEVTRCPRSAIDSAREELEGHG